MGHATCAQGTLLVDPFSVRNPTITVGQSSCESQFSMWPRKSWSRYRLLRPRNFKVVKWMRTSIWPRRVAPSNSKLKLRGMCPQCLCPNNSWSEWFGGGRAWCWSVVEKAPWSSTGSCITLHGQCNMSWRQPAWLMQLDCCATRCMDQAFPCGRESPWPNDSKKLWPYMRALVHTTTHLFACVGLDGILDGIGCWTGRELAGTLVAGMGMAGWELARMGVDRDEMLAGTQWTGR